MINCTVHRDKPAVARRGKLYAHELGDNFPICSTCLTQLKGLGRGTWELHEIRLGSGDFINRK